VCDVGVWWLNECMDHVGFWCEVTKEDSCSVLDWVRFCPRKGRTFLGGGVSDLGNCRLLQHHSRSSNQLLSYC